MNTRFLAFCATCLLGLSSLSLAAGDSGKFVLLRLTVDPGSFLYVTPKVGRWKNPDKCQNASLALLDKANGDYKDIYTALLSAQITGSAVQMRLSGCTKFKGKTRPVIIGVTVY